MAGEGRILQAALNLKDKPIKKVMTLEEDVFMLELNTVIDRDVLGNIYKKGFSRIPVYDGERGNIVGVLMSKDLILLNPDRDHLTLEQLSSIMRPHMLMDGNKNCLDALDQFMERKAMLAIVSDIREVEGRDPQIVNLGVITFEDIIEEILAQEVEDEFDPVIEKKNAK